MLSKQMIIISIIIPFIEYYSFVAINKVTQKLAFRTKIYLWIFYFVLSVAIISGLFLFRHWAVSHWPYSFLKALISVLIAFFFGKFIVAVIMFAGDILVFLKFLIKYFYTSLKPSKTKQTSNKNLISRSQFISRTSLFLGGTLAFGLSYGLSNKYNYKTRYVKVPLNGLPDEFKSIKIIQISDIHAGSLNNKDAVNEGIKMIINEKPDLILFTGDLVNYRANEIEPLLDIFGKLTAPLGVFSILGNHDYGDYISWPSEKAKKDDFDLLQHYHKTLGWKLLRNENIILNWRGKKLALAGVENWSIKARFPRYGDIRKAMKGLDSNDISMKILLSHDPSHWDAEVRKYFSNIFLTLSGHTHGMQFGIDIPGLKWSPAKYLYKQWAGLYDEANQYLYVNRGFGFIGYEGRLGILPEITVFEFV